MEYIKKENLYNFCIYYCNARNFKFGIWYAGKMYGIRHKWHDEFIDFEYHYDDGAENCGTCKPLFQLTDSIENRIHPSFFDCRNWRGQCVLHDILYPFELIIPGRLYQLHDELLTENDEEI